MSKNDGGPAFPCPGYDGGTDIEECRTFPASGMSLRDWLAGMAMQAMVEEYGDNLPESAENTGEHLTIGRMSRLYADALLAELKKP